MLPQTLHMMARLGNVENNGFNHIRGVSCLRTMRDVNVPRVEWRLTKTNLTNWMRKSRALSTSLAVSQENQRPRSGGTTSRCDRDEVVVS